MPTTGKRASPSMACASARRADAPAHPRARLRGRTRASGGQGGAGVAGDRGARALRRRARRADIWLNETRESQPSRYILPLLGVAMVVLVWTTGWAVLSRIFTGVAQFDRHLLIALVRPAGVLRCSTSSRTSARSRSARAGSPTTPTSATGCCSRRCASSTCASWGPAGYRQGRRGRRRSPRPPSPRRRSRARTNRRLVGQQSYLSGPEAADVPAQAGAAAGRFLGDTDRLKDALDKARLEPPSARGWFDNDPDD